MAMEQSAVALHDASPDPLELARLRLLYSQSKTTYAFPILAAAALCPLLWDVAERPVLAGWLVIVAAYSILRYGLLWKYRNAFPHDTTPWFAAFAGAAFVSALIWATAPMMLVPYDPSQVVEFTLNAGLVLLVVCGLAAGAAVAYAASIPVVLCFVFPVLLPPASYLILLGDRYNSMLGGFVLLYLLFIVVAALRMNRQLNQYLKIEYERECLERELNDLRRRLKHVIP